MVQFAVNVPFLQLHDRQFSAKTLNLADARPFFRQNATLASRKWGRVGQKRAVARRADAAFPPATRQNVLVCRHFPKTHPSRAPKRTIGAVPRFGMKPSRQRAPQGEPEGEKMSPGKLITQELEATAAVANAARDQALPIASALQRELGPYAEAGEPPVEWEQLQKLIGRRLAANGQSLKLADNRLSSAGLTNLQLRQQRRARQELLRQELRRVRFLFDETLPKLEARELFPLRGKLASLSPVRLGRLGHQMVEVLRRDATLVQVQADAGNLPQAAALAESVEAATNQLEAVLEAIAPEKSNRNVSFDQRKKERQETLESWRRGRDLLRGLYRVAGFDYLADQLRESRRKKAEEEGEGMPMAAEVPPEVPPVAGFRMI
jgi:hypothetical protein